MSDTKSSKKNRKSKGKSKKDSEAVASGDMDAVDGAVAGTENGTASSPDQAVSSAMQKEQLKKLRAAMELMRVQGAAAAAAEAAASAKTVDDAAKKSFEFWSTQPVPKLDEEITDETNEPIHHDIAVEKLRKDPYTLPPGYHWDTLNLDDPLVLKELYVLLNENYVEDDDNMFRFDYSPEFLRWALQPPGSLRDWHVGVRVTKNNKLFGFISAVPATIRVYDKTVKMVEINFLCVHKRLRSKRLAPVLIREITRRVNCKGLFQAVFTAGVVLPKPVGTCRYWHRSLNPKKLIEVKFSHLSKNMTMQRHIKLYRLPEETKTKGLRQLKASDIPEACSLLNKFLSAYDLSPVFSEEDFQHWFLPRDTIVDCYVIQDEGTGAITDLMSYYALPSTVMNHPTHKSLRAAYSFYNVSTKTPWNELIGDALVLAKKGDFDVFNALDLMENTSFLEKLKFGIGDGNLQYYLYNWKCPAMVPKKIGLVLQ